MFGNTAEQDDTLERPAARERYIHLSGSKSIGCIDHHVVKRQPLRLMNGDCPCQPKGHLRKRAYPHGIDRLSCRTGFVAQVLPFFGRYFYRLILACYGDAVVIQLGHYA